MHCQHLISVDCYVLNNVIIDDVIHCHYHCVALFIVYIIEAPLIAYCTSICSSLHYYNNTLHLLCQCFLFFLSIRCVGQLGNCVYCVKNMCLSLGAFAFAKSCKAMNTAKCGAVLSPPRLANSLS